MTDRVQKIREEVERLQYELIQEKEKGYGSDVDDACILELQNVLTYIDSLQEKKKVLCEDSEGECATKGIDNSLEGIIEAAILWGKYYYAKNDIPREELNQAINYYCSIFKKEEKWKQEQMMKKAIDGTARPDDNEIWCDLNSFNLKDGDRCKVVIIKEG